jgi:hypothetical protein
MDPVDGVNYDPNCHSVLLRLGGGERGRTEQDFEPAYMKEIRRATR